MPYDLLRFDLDPSTARLLGFSKVFVEGRDYAISGEENAANRIVEFDRLSSAGKAIKAIRSSGTIGLSTSFSQRLSLHVLAELRTNEKLLVLDAGALMRAERQGLAGLIRNASNALRLARKERVGIAIASFARSHEELASSMQLMLIACMLGADMPLAKQMVNAVGEAIDNK